MALHFSFSACFLAACASLFTCKADRKVAIGRDALLPLGLVEGVLTDRLLLLLLPLGGELDRNLGGGGVGVRRRSNAMSICCFRSESLLDMRIKLCSSNSINIPVIFPAS